MQVVEVGSSEEGQTLLAFLRTHLKDYPSVKAIKRAIDAKQCKINDHVEYFSTHRVKNGDRIEIALEVAKVDSRVPILFEDETIILFNKPPGKTSESFENLFLVHRLDKDTSGVILFAKSESIQKKLIAQFASRQIKKEYLAICDGKVEHPQWKVDNYLGKKVQYQGGVLIGRIPKEKGKKATTCFERLKVGESASLVLAKPTTGRTHQVRVHLKDRGHPVLGDWQYGKQFKCDLHPPRQMLHALKISFTHPVSEK